MWFVYDLDFEVLIVSNNPNNSERSLLSWFFLSISFIQKFHTFSYFSNRTAVLSLHSDLLFQETIP